MPSSLIRSMGSFGSFAGVAESVRLSSVRPAKLSRLLSKSLFGEITKIKSSTELLHSVVA